MTTHSAKGADAPSDGRRLPPVVLVLALTIFCLGTSEFMLAGLLPGMAVDLGTSLPATGTLISAFAVGMLVGAPVMAVLTLRLPRRTTLVAAGAVFALAHLAGALTDDFGWLLVTRVVAAVGCATYWAVAAVTALALTPPGQTGRAMAALMSGLTLANVLGVPAGTWVGERGGWQAAFWAVGLLALVATVVTALAVPETRPPADGRGFAALLRPELAVFTRAPLWAALATTALFQAGVFGAFSYVAPLLTEVAGLAESSVPGVLLLFGVGSFVGVTLGGRVPDRQHLVALAGFLVVLAGVLGLLAAAAGSVLVVGVVLLLGVAAFLPAAALNARVLGHARSAPTLASGVNVTAFNVGNALGPWLAGAALTAGWGFRAPALVGVGLVLAALAVVGVSWRLERTPRASTSDGSAFRTDGSASTSDGSVSTPDGSRIGVVTCGDVR